MNHGIRIRRSRFESSVPPPPPLPTSSIAAIALSRSRRSDDEIRALQQVNEDRDHLLCDFEEKKKDVSIDYRSPCMISSNSTSRI